MDCRSGAAAEETARTAPTVGIEIPPETRPVSGKSARQNCPRNGNARPRPRSRDAPVWRASDTLWDKSFSAHAYAGGNVCHPGAGHRHARRPGHTSAGGRSPRPDRHRRHRYTRAAGPRSRRRPISSCLTTRRCRRSTRSNSRPPCPRSRRLRRRSGPRRTNAPRPVGRGRGSSRCSSTSFTSAPRVRHGCGARSCASRTRFCAPAISSLPSSPSTRSPICA